MLREVRKLIDIAFADRVFKNLSLATGGTILSHGLMVLALPVLTRLFEPADFVLLAVYTSLTGLFVAVACGRFDLAIPMPQSETEGLSLLVLSLVTASCFSVLLFWLFWVWGDLFLGYASLSEFRPYKLLVPLGVFLTACNLCLEYWFTRRKFFGFMAGAKIVRAAAASGFQIALGVLSRWPAVLVIGQIVFAGLGMIIQSFILFRDHGRDLRKLSLGNISRTARTYWRFPLLSTPEAIFNKIGVHGPVLIIAGIASGVEAGFLMIAMRVLALPMMLLGLAVQQVFASEIGAQHRQGSISVFTSAVQLRLFKFAVLPILVFSVASVLVIEPVLGPSWARVGTIVLWLSPVYAMQLMVSPISISLHVAEKSFDALLLQGFGLVLRCGAVVFASFYYPNLLVEFYAVASFIFYLIYYLVVRFALASQDV
jgi:O-antigen/teichoic acid export membrane protein